MLQIDPEELQQVLASVGQKCTEATIIDLVNDIDTTGTGEIHWEDFYRVMKETNVEADDSLKTQVIDCFQTLEIAATVRRGTTYPRNS